MNDKHWLLLLIIIAIVYWLLESKNHSYPVRHLPPVPQPTKWGRLHQNFEQSSPSLGDNNLTYRQLWTQAGYDYETARQWVKRRRVG